MNLSRLSENKFSVGVVIFNLLFSLVLVIFFVNVVIFMGCFSAGERVNPVATELVRLVVYGSSEREGLNTVSARISLLDTSGNEISVIERSWLGSYLSIEFMCADIYGKRYYFPYMVKGTETIAEKGSFSIKRKGTCLFPYFIDNGRCFLYARTDERSQKDFYMISRLSKNPVAFYLTKNAFRTDVNLARCENGAYYGIYSLEDGKLVLERE